MRVGPNHRYETEAGAQAYQDKHARGWRRRMASRRELRLVAASLANFGGIQRILDVPTGTGRLLPLLLGRADEVLGIDANETMLGVAREANATAIRAGRLRLEVGDAMALEASDRSFDVAICHRLLHHVLEAEVRGHILAELARVSRSGVIVSFWDATTRKARRDEQRGRTHRRISLTPDTLAAEAQAAGLSPIGAPRRLANFASPQAVWAFRV